MVCDLKILYENWEPSGINSAPLFFTGEAPLDFLRLDVFTPSFNLLASNLVKPNKTNAHIEAFFTTKNNDLFCIVPGYRTTMKLRNFKPAAGTVISILGNSKTLLFKQTGNDCIIDLSGLKPGEMSAEVFVIKLRNAL